MSEKGVSRRDFMRGAAAAGAAFGSFTILGATAKGAGKVFRVGLVGCGGRGNGALKQHIQAAKVLNDKLNLGIDIKVVATADFFKDRSQRTGKAHGVPKERRFSGPTAYKKLLDVDLEKPTYTWDTLSVPDADYRIRVVASDSPSNPEGQSLEGEKISDPVTVDNTRPEISGLAPIKKDRGGWSVPGRAHDETSPITGIEYSLDGGDWTTLPAIDGILDSKEEFFSIEIEALDPGRHSVVVRAQDTRGNIGASRVMMETQ